MSDCILWTKYKNFKGYGVTCIKGKPRKVHRLEWEKHNGPIPVGMCVLHRCDVPACYNIDHLWLGTKADNNRDRHEKERTPFGEAHYKAKLTVEKVGEIRKLLAQGIKTKTIAESFGLSVTTIKCIETGKTWKQA